MNKMMLGARIFLGLIFAVFGANGFLHFIPMPNPPPEPLQQFATALPYFMPLLSGTQTICGLMLLTNLYAPLALVILAPITVNILMVHLLVEPTGLPMAIGVVVLHIGAALGYWDLYRDLLRPRA